MIGMMDDGRMDDTMVDGVADVDVDVDDDDETILAAIQKQVRKILSAIISRWIPKVDV